MDVVLWLATLGDERQRRPGRFVRGESVCLKVEFWLKVKEGKAKEMKKDSSS